MKTQIIIVHNYNEEHGGMVWSIQRADGEMLLPADGIMALNYSTLDNALDQLGKVQAHVANGFGQF